MKYNNAVITEEDFKKKRKELDREWTENGIAIAERYKKKTSDKNARWLGNKLGLDTDYSPYDAEGEPHELESVREL